MGLTITSTGKGAKDTEIFNIEKEENTKIIALAGNPNVGKSTVFNNLTGMRQHTGNWPGKTVTNARGEVFYKDTKYIFVDIPGTYSLFSHSKEEEIAGDFISFSDPDAVVVVCDATCLERNLNLALQILEITNNVILCVNLMDEANKKEIKLDLKALSEKLKIPVVGTSARKGKGLSKLLEKLHKKLSGISFSDTDTVKYTPVVEDAIKTIENVLTNKLSDIKIKKRWVALKLLEENQEIHEKLNTYTKFHLSEDNEICDAVETSRKMLNSASIDDLKLKDITAKCTVLHAEEIASSCVSYTNPSYHLRDRKIDKILTSKLLGIPVMILMLGVIFWLTISAANVPSEYLSILFGKIEVMLLDFALKANIPSLIYNPLIFGIYKVCAWVVSVMLPPMAIFFPLFTLLEDLGYLPRVAFNLDSAFKKCCACGKQALTMCMGFGCNAAGVTGCRIIDSPRERLIAILTNNFVPCNGRFPMLIAIITIFFTISENPYLASVYGSLLLMTVVLLGIGATFLSSYILSKTILKGTPSSFTLELPPYRVPEIGKTIVRSIFDRTLFVLGRAVLVAAPSGLIIWLFANIKLGDISLLNYFAQSLDPFGRLLGLDGTILIGFILGIPANEIVIPIIIMAYTASGNLTEMENLLEIKSLLLANGWSWTTAVSMLLFSLMHWPCSTSLITIKKETKSLKWTALAFLLPTLFGMISCFLFNMLVKLFV